MQAFLFFSAAGAGTSGIALNYVFPALAVLFLIYGLRLLRRPKPEIISAEVGSDGEQARVSPDERKNRAPDVYMGVIFLLAALLMAGMAWGVFRGVFVFEGG